MTQAYAVVTYFAYLAAHFTAFLKVVCEQSRRQIHGEPGWAPNVTQACAVVTYMSQVRVSFSDLLILPNNTPCCLAAHGSCAHCSQRGDRGKDQPD